MKLFKYFTVYICDLLFGLFKIMGLKKSSFISGKLFELIGPYFRSKRIIFANIKAYPNIQKEEMEDLTSFVEQYEEYLQNICLLKTLDQESLIIYLR